VKRLFWAAVAMLMMTVPLSAKHWHEERDHGYKHRCYIGAHDIAVFREYYAPRYKRLPPGLAKKYERTGQLPPGWAKRIEPIPFRLQPHLEPIPTAYRRGIVDGYVVVYAPRTMAVVDVVALFD
jgi:hypothetical protein